eukprot:3256604-Prorocentrum_lima.AAC.1
MDSSCVTALIQMLVTSKDPQRWHPPASSLVILCAAVKEEASDTNFHSLPEVGIHLRTADRVVAQTSYACPHVAAQ